MHPPNNPASPILRDVDSSSSLNFQGQGVLSTPQSQQSSHQPWLSTQHGRPPVPSLRGQATSQTLQQKTHMPQQSLQPMAATSQPQPLMSFSPQPHYAVSIQSQDNNAQPLSLSRNPQTLINPDQISRVQASGNQRPPPSAVMRFGPADNIPSAEALESCTRILSKRNIQELVHQVDPLEKLDPEVEDVLVEIADDFIDSVTAFGCSLAKHRKSDTLEAKDILLHLDRTWNMTLPGFGGDEIKTCKKPVGNDLHKERLAVIRKSLTGADVTKSSAGQVAGNIKGHLSKPTQSTVGS
ncbi:hypothetical protein RND81_08G067400 [Saponaria officinalis]|uniref:Transcription initiation factor TFIID subunit 12 domain-containing protein n=1 Tax=Saponaria officinalis TaxID=3572 RepID=A0AAW1J4F5_SAPOF